MRNILFSSTINNMINQLANTNSVDIVFENYKLAIISNHLK